ncbi:hypothetical protein Cadr_000004659 [Camelus dromedarius]|uniref:Uncharacterized protein n=1 Tax=Camelus dromedarius TaxID=9838 RepID=A0A5N4ECQ4_CAMDR|nr:hypothetical protein Cadr_000004659 [Camelus dromedarius]
MTLCASPTIRIAVAVLQAARDRGRFRGFSPSDPDALVPGAGNRKERGSAGSGSQEERAATRFHPVADDWLLSQLRVLTKPCSRVSSSLGGNLGQGCVQAGQKRSPFIPEARAGGAHGSPWGHRISFMENLTFPSSLVEVDSISSFLIMGKLPPDLPSLVGAALPSRMAMLALNHLRSQLGQGPGS